jgi:hypothetical protein
MTFKGHRSIYKPDGSTDDAWATYRCGHCDTKVSGAVVAYHVWLDKENRKYFIQWVLCPECALGSTLINGTSYPGSPFGPVLQGLPQDVDAAYKEARHCMKVNAYTAAELMSRKILMHVAVEKGAKEGEPFASYLSYLEQQGYVTPPMKKWVDAIRKHGNESTHKLLAPSQQRAESTVMFTAELLRLTYEMEHLAGQFAP